MRYVRLLLLVFIACTSLSAHAECIRRFHEYEDKDYQYEYEYEQCLKNEAKEEADANRENPSICKEQADKIEQIRKDVRKEETKCKEQCEERGLSKLSYHQCQSIALSPHRGKAFYENNVCGSCFSYVEKCLKSSLIEGLKAEHDSRMDTMAAGLGCKGILYREKRRYND